MKKGKLIFLVLMVCSFWYSCKDDSEEYLLELSASSFTGISSEGGTLQVDVTCNGTWTASSSDRAWCTVTPGMGTGSQPVTIDIARNLGAGTRTAIVTVSYSDRFTDDQRTRIRHVLTYSSLIPGPKNLPADTRAASDGVLNLPIRVIR